MPIRPELRKFYRTPEWYAAREAVKFRAKDRCERCGDLNHTVVLRRDGIFCLRIVIIQCGAAHLNGVAGDDRPENLAWLCRGDHLRHDKPQHRDTRAARKDENRPLLAIGGGG